MEEDFKVIDRRFITAEKTAGIERDETERDKASRGGEVKEDTRTPESMPPPDFVSFILSLGTSALMHLGETPNPVTKKYEKNLILARHTIDIIEMLADKTRGNLDDTERRVLGDLLSDLKFRYVKIKG